MNFGLISRQNDLTSLTTSANYSSVYPLNLTISLFQQLTFFSCLEARIIDAAAISDCLNFNSEASSSWISYRYWA